MNIKRSIILPVLILAVAIFSGGLVVSGTVIVASNETNTEVSEALNINLEAQHLATRMQKAQNYLDTVLDMTHFLEARVLQTELDRLTQSISNSINTLSNQDLPPDLNAQVGQLRRDFSDWHNLLQQRLGLSDTSQIPTRPILDQQAQTVIRETQKLAETSAEHAGKEIKRARIQILSIFTIAMVSTLAILGLALLFAYRRASKMSGAILQISARVLSLARIDGHTIGKDGNELNAVDETLDQLEDALQEKRRIEQTLLAAKSRAEEATKSKSRFLATMSHEIRTPINGVLGMAEILNESNLTAEQRAHTDTILASSEALLRIVNDILDFSKLEAGKTQLLHQPFDLRDVLFDVATLVAPSAAAKGVEICIDVPDDSPRVFVGDSGRLRQVLLNLIGNAVKFTNRGFVGLTLSYDANRAHPLSLKIEDTGVGIPDDQITSIFKAFEQVESTSARRFEGTGLGLAISTRLVEAMNGRISVTSQLGQGSCFTLHLNLPRALKTTPPSQEFLQLRASLQNHSVLLVCDLPFARNSRHRLLTSWGMNVTVFQGCNDAMSAVTDNLLQYDIAIVETGIAPDEAQHFATSLWKQSGRQNTPILFFTDGQHISAVQSSKSQGPITALMKPPRNGVLLRAIAASLHPDQAPKAQCETPKSAQDDLSAFHILIAEDNRTNRLVLRKMLEPTGLRMQFCNDGQAAVDAYRNGLFDLILMDMSMPIMDGVQATRMIRAIEQELDLPPCPIVALTANVMEADEEACRSAGMVDFLTKPVRKKVVLAAIQHWAHRDDQLEVGNM